MGRFQMPAAAASLATDGPTALSLIRVFVTVSVPELAMPPPRAKAHPSGPQGGSGGSVGDGSAVEGATMFWLITLSLMETVAPVVSPSAGGIHTPPPSVNMYAGGLVVVRPPVTVTRLIETVGLVGANSVPIVITGPPPLMTVACASAPMSSTLLSMVIPPANVPGPIVIVSPSSAASTAAWTVEKHPGVS